MDEHRKIVAPGVTEYVWLQGRMLKGTKEALIASGLVKPEWFVAPGPVDKKGRRPRHNELTVDGREIRTSEPARGNWTVCIFFTESEIAERKRVNDAGAPVIRFEPPTLVDWPLPEQPEFRAQHLWLRFLAQARGEWSRIHARQKGGAKLLRQAYAEVDKLYEPEHPGDIAVRSMREGWIPKFPDGFDERWRSERPRP